MRTFVFLLAGLLPAAVFSQQQDSLTLISEVVIDSYHKPVAFLKSTKSAAVATNILLQQNSAESLQLSLNLLPGTRMEERSPGSYRLSVRGSTLRSPFGIRNIKIYLDDYILTDATGNSYLNILDPAIISGIEIYKGPESGDFGAVTGGTALLKTSKNPRLEFSLHSGSFNLFKEQLSLGKNTEKNAFKIFQSYHTTESYREQSALKRQNFLLKNNWQYLPGKELGTMLLLSDLHYETPGGLTLDQLNENPRQARPATAFLPGSAEQQAGIFNKTIFGGISHRLQISPKLSHLLVLQRSYTDLRNPFISNYEQRFENNSAIRTHINFKNLSKFKWETRLGLEAGINDVLVRNYDNDRGKSANAQNFDELKTSSSFYFLSQNVEGERWNLDASLSLNNMAYRWKNIFPADGNGQLEFNNYWLPNFGFTYLLGKGFSIRTKLGKGNSAPTSEEIRSSTQEFNLKLRPEYGWNKEVGLRKQWGGFLFIEAGYFDFQLKDAIVRLQNDSGQEYFANAGGTAQRGVEILSESKTFEFSNAVISQFKGWLSGSFYHFKFKEYRKDAEDFSGNFLPGVPSATVQGFLKFQLARKIDLLYSAFYTSKLYLNDDDSVFAEPTFVNHLKLDYPLNFHSNTLNFSLHIQNIFNEKYVSGYDINAFGRRYYNPAPQRNITFGIQFRMK